MSSHATRAQQSSHRRCGLVTTSRSVPELGHFFHFVSVVLITSVGKMSSVRRGITKANPLYQSPVRTEAKSPMYEEVRLFKSDSGAGNLTRVVFILVALACVMSLVSIVVTVLILFGEIRLHESCTCSREQGEYSLVS